MLSKQKLRTAKAGTIICWITPIFAWSEVV